MSSIRDIDQRPERKELPEGWRLARLGEVCYLKTGGTPSKSDDSNFGGDIKWLVSGDINQGEIYDCVGRITTQGMVNSNAGYLPPDCVMIALNGQGKTRGSVALLCVEATCNQSLVAMIPCDRAELLPRFLLYHLQMRYQELRNLTGDSHRSGLNIGILNRLEVIFPSFSEQQRIASILKEQMGAVEKARTAAQERLRAIKALPAAFLRQIFPDPGQPLPEGWRWAKLGDVCAIVSKGTTPSSLGFSYVNEGIPFLRAEDINGSEVDPSKVAFYISVETNNALDRSRLLPGDFLITIAGTLGRVGYIAEGMPTMNCNQAVAFARPKRELVDVEYMVCVCQNDTVIAPLLSQKAGGALQNLNLQQVRGLEIPLPPLPEQQRISTIIKEQLAAIEQARIAAEAELKAINTLPAALLRRAFNGEL